ncbi:Uma2 family endonuclease [Microcoleus sp. w1-18aA5]|uniref:Uma2 family endonuclease n=1 Tax=Microcoleus sp. w1-18aA5 TaxID=2818982 RepID=UPI002FCF6B9C
MTQAILKPVTFDKFIGWYPENSVNRYELPNGAIVEMPKATGEHSEVAGFLVAELNFEIRRLGLPCFLPKECVVATNYDTIFTKKCHCRQAPNPYPVNHG